MILKVTQENISEVKLADRFTDDQTGRWFLNRYLIDYGNSSEFTVTRREVAMIRLRRNFKQG